MVNFQNCGYLEQYINIMIDNSKEWIYCAAFKTIQDPLYLIEHEDRWFEVKNVYHEPHRQTMGMVTGWRHPDIIWKFGDIIDKDVSGGFMAFKGCYVDRVETMEIVLAASQVTEKTIRTDGIKPY